MGQRHDHQDHEQGVPTTGWRISTFSNHGNCVALAATPTGVALRNSNHPELATLVVGPAELRAWLTGCKAGELDDLR